MSETTGESQGFELPRKRTLVEEAVIHRSLADDAHDDGSEGRAREGLPDSFRMRHDAHYVEHLIRSPAQSVRMIAVTDIDRHSALPSSGADVHTLAKSMKDVGVLQPLLVRPAGSRYQLIAGARRLQAAAVAGLRHVPCIVHDTDDATAEHLRGSANLRAEAAAAPARRETGVGGEVATELAESIEAASACLSLNAGDSRRTFTGRIAGDLAGIELERAGRVARALAIVADPPIASMREVALDGLVADVVEATARARRMVGVKMEGSLADADSRMRGDPRLLALALTGTADAILGRVTAPGLMRLFVRGSSVSSTLAIELSIAPSLGAVPAARFFDARDPDHPWGAWSAVLLHAAARIAEAHGGRAELRAHLSGEFTIAFTLLRK